ncbi:Gfo/Idh/MocA family oxidoreductase [Roseibacterium sp. SDUM158017]|uniref:Gfo/Idh/MocA family protein n=1 Tax=Roseicyclus salinarum TaxID=3036773 RepID=UPI0024155129|nr:Gfo/Idh/MocA family oxidoreductase [Roseibacterium sp. SDUM158017]MDG4650600.1 Gfo/Idh/MocA family oxidoreductase [Roseibacterium sp. SDUM158017]
MTANTAIIGLGIMGRRMLENMVRHPGYRPVALWDPDPEACGAALSMAPDARVTPSADEAMSAAELVYLACPPVPRKDYALAAAHAGKAVFLEKPLGVDIAQSEALVAGLRAAGVPAAVNFTQAAGAALTGVSQAARDGTLGTLVGADIVLTYPAWPRAWQKAADWLRFRDEGGMTREVVSHFLFFCERILGPLSLVGAMPSYPSDPRLCETHLLARLETAEGRPVTIMASVGGAQPDRQELTIKGTEASRRITDFYIDATSDGGPFVEVGPRPADPRRASLEAQLDDLLLCLRGEPHRLATPAEALRVQKLVEGMLSAGN